MSAAWKPSASESVTATAVKLCGVDQLDGVKVKVEAERDRAGSALRVTVTVSVGAVFSTTWYEPLAPPSVRVAVPLICTPGLWSPSKRISANCPPAPELAPPAVPLSVVAWCEGGGASMPGRTLVVSVAGAPAAGGATTAAGSACAAGTWDAKTILALNSSSAREPAPESIPGEASCNGGGEEDAPCGPSEGPEETEEPLAGLLV